MTLFYCRHCRAQTRHRFLHKPRGRRCAIVQCMSCHPAESPRQQSLEFLVTAPAGGR